MPKVKQWDGSKWLVFDAKDSDTVDGKHASDFAPIAHIGTGGDAHSLVTTAVHGFMAAADKVKLNGIETGAEVNQMAIRHITIDGTKLTSDIEEGEVKFVSGKNIALTPNTTTDTVTIALDGTVDNADKVDGFHATQSVAANNIVVRNSAGKVPGDITGDADTVDGKHASYFATADHTHSLVTTSVSGFMSAQDKTKLNGIASGAEVNQNAFSKITLKNHNSSTVRGTFEAKGKTDSITFVQGPNVIITPNESTGELKFEINSPLPHNHDERYYTETEMDTKLAGKAAASHNHDDRYLRADGGSLSNDLALGTNFLTFAGGSVSSGGLKFSTGTDHATIFLEKSGTVDSRLVIETSDDGASDFVSFRHRHHSNGLKEVFQVKYDEVDALVPLKQNGKQVYHTGNLDPSSFAAANHTHSGYAASSHTHDDRYYTKTQADGRYHNGSTLTGVSILEVQAGDKDLEFTDGNPSWEGDTYGSDFTFRGDGATEKSYVKMGGLNVSRKLRVGNRLIVDGAAMQIQIREDGVDQWHVEVNGGEYQVVRTGHAVYFEISTGGVWYFRAGLGIGSRKNNGWVLKDHDNGNVSLSATGNGTSYGDLVLGEYNTYQIRFDERMRTNYWTGSGRYWIWDEHGNGTNGSEPTMRPNSSSYGFIGTSGYPVYRMYSNKFVTSSSGHLKTNIEDADEHDCCDIIKSLRVRKYNMVKETEEAIEGSNELNTMKAMKANGMKMKAATVATEVGTDPDSITVEEAEGIETIMVEDTVPDTQPAKEAPYQYGIVTDETVGTPGEVVLDESGEGVDLYNMISVTVASLQHTMAKLEAAEARIAELEAAVTQP